MQVTGNPGRVVDHQVDIIGCVGQATDATKQKQESGQQLARDGGISPIDFSQPSKETLTTVSASSPFEGGNHRESGQQGWEEDRVSQQGVDEFPGWRHAGIHILMVETQGNRKHQEKPERKTGQRIAEEKDVGERQWCLSIALTGALSFLQEGGVVRGQVCWSRKEPN